MKYDLRSILNLLLVLTLSTKAWSQDSLFAFSYFMDNGQDGLHLAYSYDGMSWTPINNNQSILTPTAGNDRLMRDPCVIRGGDGDFHMVWTVSWNEQGIGYASSPDLIDWSEQQYIPVMEHEPDARNCWAPELFYDQNQGLYMIYWATTIPGRFPETDSSGDNGYNHRMYYTTTSDFRSYSSTKLLYQPGFNVIDATIHPVDDQYMMILKDETRYPIAEKKLRLAFGKHYLGPFGVASAPITGEVWVEGPTAIHTKYGWIIYFDKYRKHQMGAIRSMDLQHWEDISEQLHFPEGTRHGTIFRISKEELEALRAHFR